MSENIFSYKTIDNVSPTGKQSIFFTCHKDDFDKYFEIISDDILKIRDCAIYYTKNQEQDLLNEDISVGLKRMSLFVIPVTRKLLQGNCRAIDYDLKFAKDNHIPILPIMMEDGLDELYSQQDRFGELQYLKPFSNDKSEIDYKQKLKQYLESLLISIKTADRIRNAFDGYIFLSYRKKDRVYANRLMRMIHEIPEFENMAIWFDEFLTPGESFNENIENVLKKCKMFVLLVTPNLLEKPNYVMDQEYPAAIDSDMIIFPSEMVITNLEQLNKEYARLPEVVGTVDQNVFRQKLLECMKDRISSLENNDPERQYLVGLAYLEGIDMEVDVDKGVNLIKKAAGNNYPEAMSKLYNMYNSGYKVDLDYHKALFYMNKLYEYRKKTLGEEDPDTLMAMNHLAMAHEKVGDIRKALELQEKTYELQCKVLGDDHFESLTVLGNIALRYQQLGDFKKAYDTCATVYEIQRERYGDDNLTVLTTLGNLASIIKNLGDDKKALEIREKIYKTLCDKVGENHPNTITALNNLATSYGAVGDSQKAMEMLSKVGEIYEETYGLNDPKTLAALHNLGFEYYKTHQYDKALIIQKKVYETRKEILGDNHENTLLAQNNLAATYDGLSRHEEALKLKEKTYTSQVVSLGLEHPSTLITLGNIAYSYTVKGDLSKALELREKVYEAQCRVLGENHRDTLFTLNKINELKEKIRNKS